jgi:predicted porin
MNKKLIALAVASACVAGEAMAQTANPVTLYGRVWVQYESVEAKGGTAPIARRNRLSDYSSLIGVRGTEDLGGGLKAFFALETAFPAEQNTNAGPGVTTVTNNGFANRNSGVGLQGGFGSVLLGRWDTPMKITQTAVDPFADNAIGDITGGTLDQGNFSRREQNVIQYWSPTIAGFSARLHYTANELKGATNPSVQGASLAYAAGNLYVAVAYEKHKDVAANVSEDGQGIAASYKFGPVKLSGQYGRYERDGTATTAKAEDESYMLGLEWTFGKNVIIASWQHAELDNTNQECDIGSIGYRYDFSRRTSFITTYAKVENENGMNCTFGANPIGAAGQNPQGVTVGFRHTF